MLKNLSLSALAAAIVAIPYAGGDEPAKVNGQQKVIRQAMEKYQDAFNQGDARRVASFWSETGEYLTASGERIEGRDAVQAAYEALFAEGKSFRLEAKTSRLGFAAPNVAVEEGTARLTCAGDPPAEAIYEAVHVKEDGGWKLWRVREARLPRDTSHHDQLKDLSWLLGEWSSHDRAADIRSQCKWTKDETFLTRSFRVAADGRTEIEVEQYIGWDTSSQQIRSWAFDSEGGVEQAVWRRDGDRWIVDLTATLPDGREGSAQRILTPIDQNTFTWQSVNRQVAGQLLPSVEPVTIVRASGSSKK
jgi:uncharacterized protein (TIGR02246 family)